MANHPPRKTIAFTTEIAASQEIARAKFVVAIAEEAAKETAKSILKTLDDHIHIPHSCRRPSSKALTKAEIADNKLLAVLMQRIEEDYLGQHQDDFPF